MATTPVNPTNPAAASAAAAATANTPGSSLNGNDFMTLLVAQLKNQDPTNPMDPTKFVAQLVQFNSLEQLLGIKQDLDTLTSATAPAAAPATPAAASTSGANSTNSPSPTA